MDKNDSKNLFFNKYIDSMKEPSILYNYSPKRRSSLRKAVLNKYCKLSFEKELDEKDLDDTSKVFEEKSEVLMDEATNLQVTDILNHMHDLTNIFSTTTHSHFNSTHNVAVNQNRTKSEHIKNVSRISVNNTNTTISKHIWHMPVNSSSVDMALDDSEAMMASNATLPSTVTTQERINDIDLVESKLNSLKSIDFETTV